MIDAAQLARLMVQTGFAPKETPDPVPTRKMLELAQAIWKCAQKEERVKHATGADLIHAPSKAHES